MWLKKIRNFFVKYDADAVIIVCLWILTVALIIPSSILAVFEVISLESWLTIMKVMYVLWMATPLLFIISN